MDRFRRRYFHPPKIPHSARRHSPSIAPMKVPEAVDAALQAIEDCYESPLDSIRGAVVNAIRGNRDLTWKPQDVKALVAEARMADMFISLRDSGHSVAMVAGEGIDTGNYQVRPKGVGNRIGVYHHGSDRPRVEFDMLAWVDGCPVVGESKSGSNSFDMDVDYYKKVWEFRRAFGHHGIHRNLVGPSVVMGVPDDHELFYNSIKGRNLLDAGGRVLGLKVSAWEVDSYARGLCGELGIRY